MPVWWSHRQIGAASGSSAPRLVLLHGGLSESGVFDPLVRELARATPAAGAAPVAIAPYDVWAYDRRAQGRTPDDGAPLGFESMLAEAVAFLTEVVGADRDPVHLVGHSDGASLSLLLAIRRPDLVASVAAFSGNLAPKGLEPGELTPEQLVAAVETEYAAVAPDPGVLPSVAARVLAMWRSEPQMTVDQLAGIDRPVLIAAAARDSIQRSHTEEIHAAIPDATLAIVPRTTHMLVEQDPAACAALVAEVVSRAGRRFDDTLRL